MVDVDTDYSELDIERAVVVTLVPYTDTPEFREYECETASELGTLIVDIENPQHAERLVDVEINP